MNYHHLQYFWATAKEGSIAKAAELLHVAQPTISTQIKQLEQTLGHSLFRRSGRGLILTDVGQTVFSYADEIFSLGQEMLSALQQQPTDRPLRLAVGILDSMPKLVSREILKPAFRRRKRSIFMTCREGSLDQLLPELASHRLDIVLCNEQVRPMIRVKTYQHLLGESGVSIYAAPEMANKLKRDFPASLHGAPALLPTDSASIRRGLDRWFRSVGVSPMVIAEFDDLALMKTFAQEGHGFTAVHTVIEKEVGASYGLEAVGEAEGCSDQFFAVSVDRKLKHPTVVAITESAREKLFAEG